MLGVASTAEFPLSQHLGNDVLFPLAPLQQPANMMSCLSVDANGLSYGRSFLASAPPHLNLRSGHHTLDLPTVPASDIEPLNSLSSRSLPETISRDSFKSDHSGTKQHPNLTTKEIVREQNRKAAARFRQRQKVRASLSCCNLGECLYFSACPMAACYDMGKNPTCYDLHVRECSHTEFVIATVGE